MSKTNKTHKHIYIAGDLNINLLDHTSNRKVKSFVDTILQNNLIPTINKPTRVTKHSSTLIDNIITNNFHNNQFNTGIIKTDLTDHFPNFLTTDNITPDNTSSKSTIYRRQINVNSLQKFRNLVTDIDWDLVLQSSEVNSAYDLFLTFFVSSMIRRFPRRKLI